MLTSVWQQLTLSTFTFEKWRDVSLIHRLLAPLRRWRQGSRLLQWGDWIGLAIVVALFALAPYVSTTLIGVLLLAAAALWALLTLTDEAGVGMTPCAHRRGGVLGGDDHGHGPVARAGGGPERADQAQSEYSLVFAGGAGGAAASGPGAC
jgi:hypothetical protein